VIRALVGLGVSLTLVVPQAPTARQPDVEVVNTAAEVWVPLLGGRVAQMPPRAEFMRSDGDYAVHRVGSGTFTFTTVPLEAS
jgi:hypothetical protein